MKTQQIFPYGMRLGLGFNALLPIVNGLDILADAGDWWRRRRAAREVLSTSTWSGKLTRKQGYCSFLPGELRELDTLVEIGRAFYERSRKSGTDWKSLGRDGLAPMALLLSDTDLASSRELQRLATSGPLVEIVTDYFGTVPVLDNIDVWVSPPNVDPAGPYGSQLYHLDKPDRNYTTLFLNISEVGPKNGPLTFFDAGRSRTIRQQLGYDRRYYLGNGRIRDEELQTLELGEPIRLEGRAGSGGIVDTSTCIHAGSRVEEGERVVMAITYMPGHKPGTAARSRLRSVPRPDDRIGRLVLS